MLCQCHWIVLYIVHFTAFCLGGPFFRGHGVLLINKEVTAKAFGLTESVILTSTHKNENSLLD